MLLGAHAIRGKVERLEEPEIFRLYGKSVCDGGVADIKVFPHRECAGRGGNRAKFRTPPRFLAV